MSALVSPHQGIPHTECSSAWACLGSSAARALLFGALRPYTHTSSWFQLPPGHLLCWTLWGTQSCTHVSFSYIQGALYTESIGTTPALTHISFSCTVRQPSLQRGLKPICLHSLQLQLFCQSILFMKNSRTTLAHATTALVISQGQPQHGVS